MFVDILMRMRYSVCNNEERNLMDEYYEFVVSVRADGWSKDRAARQVQDALDASIPECWPRIYINERVDIGDF